MLHSIRYALRQLRKSPGFAITAILTLALGIGATTAIFSVLDAVLLEPLPFPQPDRLVALTGQPWGVSIPTVQDWQERSRSFLSIAAYRGAVPTVRSTQGAEAGQVMEVTQNFLGTLGTGFALGHDFTQTGNEQDCFSQVVVSGAFWNRLGGGSALGNRTLAIDRHTYQIIGVLPLAREFEGPDALNHPEVLLPIGCDPFERPAARGSFDYLAIGRMRSGVTLAQAAADLNAVQRPLNLAFPGNYTATFAPVLIPLRDFVAGTETRSALFATLAGCGLLLLIACANLANLLLARNTRRRHEFATRATLGASFSQLLTQLMTESAVLAAIGAAAGIALAATAIRLLKTVAVLHLARLGHASLPPRVLLFAVGVTTAVTILLTLLPAIRTLRSSLLQDLAQSGGRSASSSSSLRGLGRMLVTAQIAFAMVLLASAGWMISSVYLLLHQPLGFTPDHLLLAGVDVHGSSVSPAYDAARTAAYFDQAIESMRRLPGVQAAAAANHPPLSGSIDRSGFCSDAHPEDCHRHNLHEPDSVFVTPGYFATIGQPLYRGRDFTDSDNGQAHVAIVNRALAEQEWPGQDAVGKRIFTGNTQAWATVVGVVGDVHNFDLATPPNPNLFLPNAEQPKTAMTLVLRTSVKPELLEETVRRVLQQQHPDLALFRLQPMETRMAHEVALRRFFMEAAAGFGLLALLLAVLGTYGLLAYEVSVREKEIGIRLALGSTREAVVQLLLAQESRWILLGAVAGLFGAGLTGYALRAEFYQAQTASLPVLGGSLLLLVIPALVAIALPARRAAHLDLVQTLRSE